MDSNSIRFLKSIWEEHKKEVFIYVMLDVKTFLFDNPLIIHLTCLTGTLYTITKPSIVFAVLIA